MTVAELCDMYIADAEAGRLLTRKGAAKKASTLTIDRGRIERHIKPLLGDRPALVTDGFEVTAGPNENSCYKRPGDCLAVLPFWPGARYRDVSPQPGRSQASIMRKKQHNRSKPCLILRI